MPSQTSSAAAINREQVSTSAVKASMAVPSLHSGQAPSLHNPSAPRQYTTRQTERTNQKRPATRTEAVLLRAANITITLIYIDVSCRFRWVAASGRLF